MQLISSNRATISPGSSRRVDVPSVGPVMVSTSLICPVAPVRVPLTPATPTGTRHADSNPGDQAAPAPQGAGWLRVDTPTCGGPFCGYDEGVEPIPETEKALAQLSPGVSEGLSAELQGQVS